MAIRKIELHLSVDTTADQFTQSRIGVRSKVELAFPYGLKAPKTSTLSVIPTHVPHESYRYEEYSFADK